MTSRDVTATGSEEFSTILNYLASQYYYQMID